MATNWTEAQLNAIEAKKEKILVSAAAGSGKTATLIERIIMIMVKMILNQSFRYLLNQPKLYLPCQIRITLFTLILFQRQFLHLYVSDIWFYPCIL